VNKAKQVLNVWVFASAGALPTHGSTGANVDDASGVWVRRTLTRVTGVKVGAPVVSTGALVGGNEEIGECVNGVAVGSFDWSNDSSENSNGDCVPMWLPQSKISSR